MKVPRLLEAGSLEHPLVIVRSGFWQFNAAGIFHGDQALVIDPGIYPEDIALLGAAVTTRARSGPPRHVTQVILTHSHHDHIRGWARFPGAEVIMPRVAAEKGPDARARIVAAKAKVDQRLGIEDETFAYPRADRTFEQPTQVRVGELEVHLLPLYGHSNCCSVVWVPALRALFSADYLVTPGTPYCRWEMPAMEAALDDLARFAEEHEVETIWPAHYAPLRGSAAIRAGLHQDREALRILRSTCEQGLAQGQGDAEILRAATRAARAWRGSDSKASRLQDLDNAQRMLASCRG